MFHLIVLNPDSVLFDDKVESVFLPSIDGVIEVLSNHAPLVGLLGRGSIRIVLDLNTNTNKTIDVNSTGFVKVLDNMVSVVLE